ncbi:hypothetical protein T10_8411 [Trichinella papuae]|uniref:Uncharacterized protein n=1 Tax=Trichinella papuae TaxID=268474 RepID=A0A0V1M6Q1_9BILA|nr:hypothetical protein T10_8411 [Trichinella papuae]
MAVFFLELRIDAESIHPTEEKVASIKHFQTSRTDLEAFLGTLKFYDIFLPQKATIFGVPV